MKEAKTITTVHNADSVQPEVHTIGGGPVFHVWKIGEVSFYFDDLLRIADVCNRTLEAIEKIDRDRASADVREIAHF